MLHDLVKLRKAQWDDELYGSILSRAKIGAAKRDLIAHGKWAHRDDGWYVELARGAWPKDLAELIAKTKKIMPELVPMDTDKLREATSAIVGLIGDLKRLRKSTVGPLWPSPDTRPAQCAQRRQIRGHKLNRRSRPRRPSPA
jgi:hypothetical protein